MLPVFLPSSPPPTFFFNQLRSSSARLSDTPHIFGQTWSIEVVTIMRCKPGVLDEARVGHRGAAVSRGWLFAQLDSSPIRLTPLPTPAGDPHVRGLLLQLMVPRDRQEQYSYRETDVHALEWEGQRVLLPPKRKVEPDDASGYVAPAMGHAEPHRIHLGILDFPLQYAIRKSWWAIRWNTWTMYLYR